MERLFLYWDGARFVATEMTPCGMLNYSCPKKKEGRKYTHTKSKYNLLWLTTLQRVSVDRIHEYNQKPYNHMCVVYICAVGIRYPE